MARLMIIDGHLRAETTPDAMVPVLVLDVTEEEADKILLDARSAGGDGRVGCRADQGAADDGPHRQRSGAGITEAHRRTAAVGNPSSREMSRRPRSRSTAPTSFEPNGVPSRASSGRSARTASSAVTAPT